MKKPKIKINKESVVIGKDGKRYEVYFDTSDYAIFIGQPNGGAFIKISGNDFGKLEFWQKW